MSGPQTPESRTLAKRGAFFLLVGAVLLVVNLVLALLWWDDGFYFFVFLLPVPICFVSGIVALQRAARSRRP